MTSVNWLPVIYIPGKERLAQLVSCSYVLFLGYAKSLADSTRDLARQLIKLMRTVHLQTRCRDNPHTFVLQHVAPDCIALLLLFGSVVHGAIVLDSNPPVRPVEITVEMMHTNCELFGMR